MCQIFISRRLDAIGQVNFNFFVAIGSLVNGWERSVHNTCIAREGGDGERGQVVLDDGLQVLKRCVELVQECGLVIFDAIVGR